MGLLIEAAVAKTNKYASRESGDTAEIVERPTGGLSLVLADGQGTGRAAKTLSLMVTSKAVALLKEGVRDGAVARAVHDTLFAYRHGQVSATLDLLSVDLRTGEVVVTRNAETPLLVGRADRYETVPTTSGPIGRYPMTRPQIVQLPAEAGTTIAVVSDGITAAGRGDGPGIDLAASATLLGPGASAAALADSILSDALARDGLRPGDDMTVLVLALGRHDESLVVRRMTTTLPVP